jgi:hypothetical protein
VKNDDLNTEFNIESKFEIKMGPFYLKTQRWPSISGISGSIGILKMFYLNLEQLIIVGYQFSYKYDFGKSESFQ